jgi:tol-pal system protein YbgF
VDLRAFNGWVALLTILGVIMLGGCAFQEDLVIVNDRLTAFESEAEADRAALRSEMERLDEDYRGRHAELHSLMKDMREEMQRFRGLLEENQYDTQQKIGALATTEATQKERWTKVEESIQISLDRIVRLEQYLGMEPSEKLAPLGSEKAEPSKPKAKKTPDELYAAAKQQFDRGEYEAAREQFQAFLDQHPKSKQADNAQFWLGEVFYREKWYEKAILEYQKVIENYPKGDKIRGALLKQGFSFLNLDDKSNARLILRELIRKYPDSNEAEIAKKKLKTLQ